MSVIVKGMEMPVMCSYCKLKYYGQGDNYACCYCSITDKEIDYIAKHPDCPLEEADDEWIPCSERLPEIDEEVLVTDGEIYWVCSLFESPDIEDGLYQWEDNYGHWHEFKTWIAWMPLPKPYEPKEDN